MFHSKDIIAIPPGETIREQLENRGMSQKEFAKRMGMAEKEISQLISGEIKLTPHAAIRLEVITGLPANFWNKLEVAYRDKLAQINLQKLK